MTFVDDMKRLSVNDVALTIGAFLSIVGPGLLILHLFRPDLILSLDTFKLILFCVSLTLPVVIINMLGLIIVRTFFPSPMQSQPPNDVDRIEMFGLAMALAFSVLYPSLLIAYLSTLPFRQFLLALAIVQALVFLAMYLFSRAESGSCQGKS